MKSEWNKQLNNYLFEFTPEELATIKVALTIAGHSFKDSNLKDDFRGLFKEIDAAVADTCVHCLSPTCVGTCRESNYTDLDH